MTTPDPKAPPRPGFVRLAVTFFAEAREFAIDEARSLLRQGLVRDAGQAETAIGEAEEALRQHHEKQGAPAAAAPSPATPAASTSAATPAPASPTSKAGQ